MVLQNKKSRLLNPEANREYYKQSDGHFMDLEDTFYAHRFLDRVAWARDVVHWADSRTHIDLGCKDGYLCLTLESEGVECIGIDPSEDAIEEAREKARAGGLDTTFIIGCAEDIPDNIKADTVSCLEVVEHVIDPEILIERLSKMGDLILISTPDINGRHGAEDMKRNDEHLRMYSEKDLIELVSKYGNVLDCVIRDDQLCLTFEPKKYDYKGIY